jgi:hypothetical protein
MSLELELGHLHLSGELRGVHVHVTVRGVGAEGSRPLLGTLVMAGIEWSSLQMLVDIQVANDRQQLADRAELVRLDGLVARERHEHLHTAAKLERLADDFQPIRSVLADWAWQAIAADGWQCRDYERAMEAVAKAMAAVEANFERAKKEQAGG